MKHTISVLVENRFGVLARVAGLFSSRGFNIDSLAVGRTDDETVSRMTIVVDADDRILEQVKKQLNKLIDVIKVYDHEDEDFIDRELVLVKVSASGPVRSEVMQIADIFRAKVVDVSPKTITVEATGNTSKVEGFIELMADYGIREIVRTGCVAMSRGATALRAAD